MPRQSHNRAKDGESNRVAVLLERIAALETANAELQREKAAIEAANEAKSRFLASVSHEIRSPLNSIYGYAQLLERSDGANAVQAAKIIRRSSEHLANLVEGLSDLSQVESGVLRLNREVIRFPALLEQMVDMFEPQAAAKGLAFRFDRRANLPEFVRGDQKRLRQVLINLLSNAIKFTERGHVALTVHHRNDIATFEVTDTGIGVPQSDIERIFDPFQRGSDTSVQRRPGVGLGLAITQALVHIMGGEIRVESEFGTGTRFMVRLMLSQPLSEPADTTPAATVSGYSGSRRSVLVVDDDPTQSAMLQSLLAPLGFAVFAASNGDEAIAIAEEALPDLVLLDISMPGKSGWETADILRNVYGPALRIVMLSADTHDFRSGGDGEAVNDMFVMKPFEFSKLLDVISAQLGLEWTGADPAGDDNRESHAALRLPRPLPPRARSCFAEIERLVRIGDVRGIEAQIDAIAGMQPEAIPIVEEMRVCLDTFDLKALAAISKASQTHGS